MDPTSPSSLSQAETMQTSRIHDEDTLKEVYAAPNSHYLGTPNPLPKGQPGQPGQPAIESYPEVSPSDGLEVIEKPPQAFSDDSHSTSRSAAAAAAAVGGIGGGAAGLGTTTAVSASKLNSPDAPLPPIPKKDWKKSWNIRIFLVIGGILILVAVILGAVLGTRAANNNKNNNNSGSSDNAVNGGNGSTAIVSLSKTASATDSATTTADVPSSTATSIDVDVPKEADVAIGKSFNATFTHYGTGDGTGGSNCNVPQNACGFYSKPGYAAGVSQNLFGAGPGQGKGMACSSCWFLESFVDASGHELKKNITVIVNDLCPADSSGVCRQRSLTDLNSWETQVDFNLCIDSGASDAMFGKNSGIGLSVGRATRVECSTWSGTIH